MSSYALPFPGRDLAEKELSYDPCCPRIPEADRARIVDAAWEKAAPRQGCLCTKRRQCRLFCHLQGKPG